MGLPLLVAAGFGLGGVQSGLMGRRERREQQAEATGLAGAIGQPERPPAAEGAAPAQGPPEPATGAFQTVQDPALRGQLEAARGLLGTPGGQEQARGLFSDVFQQQQAQLRQTRGFETQERLQRERLEAQAAGTFQTPEQILAGRRFEQIQTVDLRNNFQRSTANYVKARQALSAARQAQAQGTGFGNIALLQLFIRSLDPGGRVTEGEVQVTGAAAGLFNELKAELDRIEGTGGVLSAEASQQLLAAAEAIFAPIQADFDVLEAQTRQEAIRRNIDPRSVFVGSLLSPEQAQEQGIPVVDSSALDPETL